MPGLRCQPWSWSRMTRRSPRSAAAPSRCVMAASIRSSCVRRPPTRPPWWADERPARLRPAAAAPARRPRRRPAGDRLRCGDRDHRDGARRRRSLRRPDPGGRGSDDRRGVDHAVPRDVRAHRLRAAGAQRRRPRRLRRAAVAGATRTGPGCDAAGRWHQWSGRFGGGARCGRPVAAGSDPRPRSTRGGDPGPDPARLRDRPVHRPRSAAAGVGVSRAGGRPRADRGRLGGRVPRRGRAQSAGGGPRFAGGAHVRACAWCSGSR